MNPELAGLSEWNEAWRAMRIYTQGQVRQVDERGLQRGQIEIEPGIPGERPTKVYFMLEGHTLELSWIHGRLASHATEPPPGDHSDD